MFPRFRTPGQARPAPCVRPPLEGGLSLLGARSCARLTLPADAVGVPLFP